MVDRTLWVCGWQKNDFGSVFDLVLQKTAFFGFIKFTAESVFSVRFLHCVLFNVYALY